MEGVEDDVVEPQGIGATVCFAKKTAWSWGVEGSFCRGLIPGIPELLATKEVVVVSAVSAKQMLFFFEGGL